MRYRAGSIAGVPLFVSESFAACATLAGLFGARRVAQVDLRQPTPFPSNWRDTATMDAWLDAAAQPPVHPSTGWIVAAGIGIALVYILSILAHELAHLFAARKVGVGPTAINLDFAGGSVELEDADRFTAGTLALVVVAGPLVTALLLLATIGVLRVHGEWGETGSGALVVFEHVCGAAVLFNAIALAVNLLPIRPLDGGQLLLAARLRSARGR